MRKIFRFSFPRESYWLVQIAMIDLPLHMVGFVSWCATLVVALVVVVCGGASRLSIGALAATYLLLGFGAVLTIGGVSGLHYSYSDVRVNGELLPADDEWLIWHSGVSIGYAALVWRSRTWPLGTPSAAWFVLVPIVAELLLRPRRWEWLLLYEASGRRAAATVAPVLFAAILTMALARWRAAASASERPTPACSRQRPMSS
jgi:hypothetical protein